MPKVTRLEVLKIIKADEHLKMIPVVVLSSSRETPDLTECYRHGVNAYVVSWSLTWSTLKQFVHPEPVLLSCD